MYNDWTDYLIWGFMGLVLVVFVCILAVEGIEAVQDYRSFPAQVACKSKRMLPERRALSAKIICVPAITRQDTLTLQRP